MTCGGQLLAALTVAMALLFVATSGRYLVINQPEHADVIVVLAGETDQRPVEGLRLLRAGYAPRMLLDVPAQSRIYDLDQVQLADQYVKKLSEENSIRVCPIYGLSTKAEAFDVGRCLQGQLAGRILLVTSSYHTRRALSTFRHQLPQFQYSVAAAPAREDFEVDWWRQRQWAKVNFDEWLRLAWWEAVDRWH